MFLVGWSCSTLCILSIVVSPKTSLLPTVHQTSSKVEVFSGDRQLSKALENCGYRGKSFDATWWYMVSQNRCRCKKNNSEYLELTSQGSIWSEPWYSPSSRIFGHIGSCQIPSTTYDIWVHQGHFHKTYGRSWPASGDEYAQGIADVLGATVLNLGFLDPCPNWSIRTWYIYIYVSHVHASHVQGHMHTHTYLHHAIHEEQWLDWSKLAQSCWWQLSRCQACEYPCHAYAVYVTLVEIWWVGTGWKHGKLFKPIGLSEYRVRASWTKSSALGMYWDSLWLTNEEFTFLLSSRSLQFGTYILTSWSITNMLGHVLRSCLYGSLCKNSWLNVVPGHVFWYVRTCMAKQCKKHIYLG